MPDTIQFDHEDPDNRPRLVGGAHGASPAMERAQAAIASALASRKAGKPDRRCIIEARSHIKRLGLSPGRLIRFHDKARSITSYANEQPPQACLEARDCTWGEWCDAAWIICRASASVIVETVRPTSYSDFEHLYAVARGMPGLVHLPLSGREKRRFVNRMKGYLECIIRGEPVDLLTPVRREPTAATERAPIQRPGRRAATTMDLSVAA